MVTVQQLQQTIEAAKQMVGNISAADLAKPTPCTEWNVQALVEHMIDTNCRFSAAASGQEAPRASGSSAAELIKAYSASGEAAVAAWQTPGVLDRTLKLPFGEAPGAVAMGINLGDQLLHIVDLGRALGRSYSIDADLAEGMLTMMHQILRPEFRGPGKGFAEEVPCAADAPVQSRLLAFSGRQP
jgi:uncharacterized protein (TIGR03086 family)